MISAISLGSMVPSPFTSYIWNAHSSFCSGLPAEVEVKVKVKVKDEVMVKDRVKVKVGDRIHLERPLKFLLRFTR